MYLYFLHLNQKVKCFFGFSNTFLPTICTAFPTFLFYLLTTCYITIISFCANTQANLVKDSLYIQQASSCYRHPETCYPAAALPSLRHAHALP